MEITKILKTLKIPYDKNFYNISFDKYELLAETIGVPKVTSSLRELLLYHKDNPILAEKVRIIIRKLNKPLMEKVESDDIECECGYLNLTDDELCPVCNKAFYKGKVCYYKVTDFCSADGEECKWNSQKECGKDL